MDTPGSINNPESKSMPKRKKKNDDSQLISSNQQQPKISSKDTTYFRLNVQGMIEGAQFFDGDSIYCKYDITSGPDWTVENGQKWGQSQHSCQGEGSSNYFVWNMPFEISLKSTNPSGWPQLVISCFCPDFFGREVLKAYGLVYIPTTPGMHSRTLQMFSPLSSSVIIDFVGAFLGQKAELINAPKVLSTGEGREIIRTQSEGSMTVKFNVQLTNMEIFGYNL